MKKIIIFVILSLLLINIVFAYEPTYSKSDKREIILDRIWELFKGLFADYGLILFLIIILFALGNWLDRILHPERYK